MFLKYDSLPLHLSPNHSDRRSVVKHENQKLFLRFTYVQSFSTSLWKPNSLSSRRHKYIYEYVCVEPVVRVHASHACRRSCRPGTAKLTHIIRYATNTCFVLLILLNEVTWKCPYCFALFWTPSVHSDAVTL